jgi:hypothetical protein
MITALADHILALARADALARRLERFTGAPRRVTLALARVSLRLSLLLLAASTALALASAAAPPAVSGAVSQAASLTLWLSLASLCIAPMGAAAIGTISRWTRRM